MPLAFLEAGLDRSKRRSVEKDIEAIPSLRELYLAIMEMAWPYKTSREFLHHRDRALACLMLLTGCRVSEGLRLKRHQFSPDEESSWLILRNLKTVKGKVLRPLIKIPREGEWKQLTEILESWLRQLPSEDAYLFPVATGAIPSGYVFWDRHLDRRTAWNIMRHTLKLPGTNEGGWNHYFRAVCESKYGEIFKSTFLLRKFIGVKSDKAVEPYVHLDIEPYERRILQAK